MIDVIVWRWAVGGAHLFGREYVEKMRSMLARHLHIPHRLHCVTDDQTPIAGVTLIPMPVDLRDTPRCRRRMRQYDAEFDRRIGSRLLSIDLDVVLVDDITPLVDRPEPIVMWKVGYAQVYSGSFVLWTAGALDGAWQGYRQDPEGFPRRASPHGVGSDQAMLNYWLNGHAVAEWTEADGFVTWFGMGYARLEKNGMGPLRTELPPGARVIVLGSADKAMLDEGRYEWVRRHWC